MIGCMTTQDREALISQIKLLTEENQRLKNLLKAHGIECSQDESRMTELSAGKHKDSSLKQHLSPQQKIELFRNLFRGREDVFALRWYSVKTGKSGYQPVCAHEWDRLLCDKKKFKCSECPNRQLTPLNDDDIFQHLAGRDELCRDVIGLYPMLKDETCWFLCADFDDKSCKHGYQSDVLAFADVCKSWGIHYSIERSRSGNGAHVWVFFSRPIAAGKARKLGNAILTEAMNRDGRISFQSYDRLFPNQDHLPDGGFGNLIALPLQGHARRLGNSVFVNDDFTPYPDQWEYLLSVRKLSVAAIKQLLREHANEVDMGELVKSSEAQPWETPIPARIAPEDFPKEITMVKSNMIYIPLLGLAPKMLNHLKRMASFKNPEFFSRMGMRLPTYNIPRIISCVELSENYLALPRGCENGVMDFFTTNHCTIRIDNQSYGGKNIHAEFVGTLRDDQEDAIVRLTQHDTGTLSATTAFGKTVTAIALIAKQKTNTLILVHNKALLEQWKRRLEDFLHLEYNQDEVLEKGKRRKRFSPFGCLYSQENSLHGLVDIALMQSCISNGEVKPFLRNYGMIIVDECHHVSSVMFEQVLRYANARFVYGLTATPIRKDGHQPIIFMQCGPIRYSVDSKTQMLQQSFQRVLIPRFSSFRSLSEDKQTYHQIIQELSEDDLRNQLIVKDVVDALNEKRTPIVISRLVSHVHILASLLRPFCPNVFELTGAISAKEQRQMMAQLQGVASSEPMIIVATINYIGEGFDYPRLDTLFLTLPMSYKGIVIQYTGRLHREYKGKSEVRVYDYVDAGVPMCDTMYHRRLRGYSAAGYHVRTSKEEASLSDTFIFHGNNFKETFLQDVCSAKQSIVISCSKIKIYRDKTIVQKLLMQQANGVKSHIFVHSAEGDMRQLINYGLSVTTNDNLTLQCAIIDKSIVWYGDINILGFHSPDNSVMRLHDTHIANKLLSLIYDHQPPPTPIQTTLF
ncbi:MAG: DEAD/DEAH box helicase family protein [Prevotella sp.]|nr:DEAD/DEAH box helicase family protein [Prevotella sp.]